MYSSIAGASFTANPKLNEGVEGVSSFVLSNVSPGIRRISRDGGGTFSSSSLSIPESSIYSSVISGIIGAFVVVITSS